MKLHLGDVVDIRCKVSEYSDSEYYRQYERPARIVKFVTDGVLVQYLQPWRHSPTEGPMFTCRFPASWLVPVPVIEEEPL